ncbi:MAG: amylo-alpha-1,6-glucosidase, partial [bacterium]
ADAFLVRRGKKGQSVIAGYPWFGDWGRDAMIALPGLAVLTRRLREAENVLLTFGAFCMNGIIPNFFTEANKPMYNSADASLWYILAAWELWKATRSRVTFRENIWKVIKEIVFNYSNGTLYDIRQHTFGLLTTGTPETQLTWMDAKVGDNVITSRHGMAVEMNALWYNALCIASHLASIFNEPNDDYSQLSHIVRKSFNTHFWNNDYECLFDVVHANGEKDASIRPNQVLAISLPFSLLPQKKALKVMECIEKNLLTPYGLRSLAASDNHYKGTYAGNVWERDSAYHQGTVWSWLIGPYITAYFKLHGKNSVSISHIKKLLNPLIGHLTDQGVGYISEIFDGDTPQEPRGCIAQAWSVAETLMILYEIERFDQAKHKSAH